MNNTVKILRCTCSHKFQDQRYGTNMRVMNKTANVATPTYRCTVCGSTRAN